MARALLPLKNLATAKSRLAGLLRPSERRALAQAMAEDVLGALARVPPITEVILLSDDPCAPLLAERYGARCWPEQQAGGRGLNGLLEAATARLLARDDAPVLVLHADLPLLQPADLAGALVERRPGELVVGCDRHGGGTNLLVFDAASRPRFCFGPDSCRRHLDQARAAGVAARLLRREGIALDVDQPADLALLLERLPAAPDRYTARLLCGTALGSRIALALASLVEAAPAEQGRAV